MELCARGDRACPRGLMWVRARCVYAAVALGINVAVGLGSSDVQELVVAAGIRGIGEDGEPGRRGQLCIVSCSFAR